MALLPPLPSFNAEGADIVAIWEVPLSSSTYRIEFEHGTTTGKRIIRVNGKEILRRDWMFKLVGKEAFNVGTAKCVISIETAGTFSYAYSLQVNGKSYQKFTENQSKLLQTWTLSLNGVPTRICLEKDSLDVYVNGTKKDTAGEFIEGGTETHFEIGEHVCCITALSSGRRKKGMLYTLTVDGQEIPPEES